MKKKHHPSKIDTGVTLDFSMSGRNDECCINGFYAAEESGRWSSGEHSLLHVIPPLIHSFAEMHLFLNPYIDKNLPRGQEIKILINNELVYENFLIKRDQIRIRIREDIFGTGRMAKFDFWYSTPVVPANAGTSKDLRSLAFFFESLGIYDRLYWDAA